MRLPRAFPPAIGQVLAFSATTVLLTLYAVDRGGYDIVARQTFASAIWLALAGGWLTGALPRVRLAAGVRWAAAGLTVLGGLTAASLAWTESAERTFAEVARVLGYLGLVVLVGSLVGRELAAPVAAGCLAAGAAGCAMAIGSRLLPSVFSPVGSTGVFSTTRLSYPLNYYNAVAAWGALTLVLATAMSAHAHRWTTRAAMLAVVPLAGLTVFLTYSRAGILDVLLGLVVVLILARHRWTVFAHAVAGGVATAVIIVVVRRHREIADGAGTDGALTAALVLAACMLACGAAAAALRGLDPVRLAPRLARATVAVGTLAAASAAVVVGPAYARRAWRSFAESQAVTPSDPLERLGTFSGNRHEIWSSAIDAFRANPLRGTGAGTFEFWFSRNGGITSLKDAHSLFLEPMAELGLFGPLGVLLLLGGLLVGAVVVRRRNSTSALLGVSAAGAAIVAMFSFHAGVDWLWECTAVTALALTAATAANGANSERRGPPAWLWRLAGTAAALTAVAIQLPGIAAQRELRASQAAAAAGRSLRALRLADAAVGAEPWAASPMAQRALVLERLGQLRASKAAIDAAELREPTNWRHPYVAARIDAELGDAGAALSDLRRARQLRPRSRFLPGAGG